MNYLAIYETYEDNNLIQTGMYLTDSNQMDAHLQRNAKIYCEDGGEMTLIATKEDGFLVERPVFPETHTMQIN